MNELAQDSALPPQITLKPILSSATMTTAKQSDFKSSSFRGEYTHELDSVLAHPLHIGEVRDGPQQRCWNQMIFKGPFQPRPFWSCDSFTRKHRAAWLGSAHRNPPHSCSVSETSPRALLNQIQRKQRSVASTAWFLSLLTSKSHWRPGGAGASSWGQVGFRGFSGSSRQLICGGSLLGRTGMLVLGC